MKNYKQKHLAKPIPKTTTEDIVLPNGVIVQVTEGDITKVNCDTIVSSSSPELSHKSE